MQEAEISHKDFIPMSSIYIQTQALHVTVKAKLHESFS